MNRSVRALVCFLFWQRRARLVRQVETLLKARLRKLPDLEKLLSNVHAMGSKVRAESHPDSRARIFDADKVTKTGAKQAHLRGSFFFSGTSITRK